MNSPEGGLMFTMNKGTEGEICANQHGTIRELHHIIPEVSKTTIHEDVTKKLGSRKL
jgi:hypothetical protein